MRSLTAGHLPRDPAPSRWAYRYQRLWLTPVFRSLLRTGVPAFLLAFFGGWALTDTDARARLGEGLSGIRRAVVERPEFMVSEVAIDGASRELAYGIREILPFDLPRSVFDIDLDAAREAVAELDAVAAADLRIGSGGELRISVSERIPVAVWRVGDRLELLDETGHRVAPLSRRGDRADLPLLAGVGADAHVGEALALARAAAPIRARLRGFVRIGERRWDVALDRGLRIMLPESDPVPALERVLALDAAEDLLARDLVAVDMRLPDRPTLRMAPTALEAALGAGAVAGGGEEG